jgi:streptogramin lyase
LVTYRRPSAIRLFALVFALVTGLAIALGTLLSAAQAAPEGKLTQFKVPTAGSSPEHITRASDGNFWFTESFVNDQNTQGHKVGRLNPDTEVITEFVVCDFCFPNDIVQGSDGFLYFSSNDGLGRISTEGVVEPFINAPFSVGGQSLATHGDDIWLTDFNNRSIWRYDISEGAFTEFPLSNLGPSDVAVDETGMVWFADQVLVGPSTVQGVIGRLDPSDGSVTTFNVDGLPRAVSIATDGAVWFTERFTPQGVGRLDPVTGESTVFAVDGGPLDIAPATGGSMWFSRTTAGNIARISPAGVITAESKVVKGSEPFGITVAPDGNPWFTMLSADKIATLQLR